MCCQSTTDGNVTHAAKLLNDSTSFVLVQSLRLSGNAYFEVRIYTVTKRKTDSTHPFEIKGEVQQMLVRLGGAATFPSLHHCSRQLVGKWGPQPISGPLINVGGAV